MNARSLQPSCNPISVATPLQLENCNRSYLFFWNFNVTWLYHHYHKRNFYFRSITWNIQKSVDISQIFPENCRSIIFISSFYQLIFWKRKTSIALFPKNINLHRPAFKPLHVHLKFIKFSTPSTTLSTI